MIRKLIKILFVIAAVLALGYCGKMDLEYQQTRTAIVTKGGINN